MLICYTLLPNEPDCHFEQNILALSIHNNKQRLKQSGHLQAHNTKPTLSKLGSELGYTFELHCVSIIGTPHCTILVQWIAG